MSGFRISRDYISESRKRGNEKRREEAKVAVCGGRARRPTMAAGSGGDARWLGWFLLGSKQRENER